MTPVIRVMQPITEKKQLVEVEQEAFEYGWSEAEFLRAWGWSAWDGARLIGFLAAEGNATTIQIINMGVRKAYRRMGVGKRLIGAAVQRLKVGRRGMLAAVVWERNLDAQLFFKAVGFRCRSIVEAQFATVDGEPGPIEHAYYMVYRVHNYSPDNRIKNYFAQ